MLRRRKVENPQDLGQQHIRRTRFREHRRAARAFSFLDFRYGPASGERDNRYRLRHHLFLQATAELQAVEPVAEIQRRRNDVGHEAGGFFQGLEAVVGLRYLKAERTGPLSICLPAGLIIFDDENQRGGAGDRVVAAI